VKTGDLRVLASSPDEEIEFKRDDIGEIPAKQA
jgi:hypothetical protein